MNLDGDAATNRYDVVGGVVRANHRPTKHQSRTTTKNVVVDPLQPAYRSTMLNVVTVGNTSRTIDTSKRRSQKRIRSTANAPSARQTTAVILIRERLLRVIR